MELRVHLIREARNEHPLLINRMRKYDLVSQIIKDGTAQKT